MRMQLRNSAGQLLAGKAEDEHIASFLRTVCHGTEVTESPQPAPVTGIPFTAPDLVLHFRSLELTRRCQHPWPPALLWKLVPDQVVDALLPIMNLASSTLEQRWHPVQLHLIPKVSIATEPNSLRPIALLHPGNKLLAIMISNKVEWKIASYLEHVPQWAHLKNRSTADALESVCSHLHQVRMLLHTSAASLPQRFQGSSLHKMVGGVSINPDIRKAFDSLPHSFLEEAMRDANFDEQETGIIMRVHEQASMSACWQVSLTLDPILYTAAGRAFLLD